MKLTQKEQMLLKDQQKHEELCVQKYGTYSGQAQDPKLKQLFSTYASQEQQHLDTVNQILSGQVPNMSQQGQTGAGQGAAATQGGYGGNAAAEGPGQALMQNTSHTTMQNTAQDGSQAGQSAGQMSAAPTDAELCNDMLVTEKYISGAYDTAIFEFTDPNVRQTLNHIQKEEQQHGEGLFNYLQETGNYNPQ